MTRIVLNITDLSIVILAFIIYKTGYIYWYNGVGYEEAVKAGSERRKIYALEHFRRFGMFGGGYFVFSVIAHGCGWNIWWDVLIVTVGMIVTAVSTIGIRL